MEAPAGTDVWDGSVDTFFGGGSGTDLLRQTTDEIPEAARAVSGGGEGDAVVFTALAGNSLSMGLALGSSGIVKVGTSDRGKNTRSG